MTEHKPATLAAQAAIGTDTAHRAIIPPIHLSATYEIPAIGTKASYEYSRTRNPTRDDAANAIQSLEGGCGAWMTSSGMAALTLILHLLGPTDLLLAPYDCYGRSYRLLQALAEKNHFRLAFFDPYDTAALREAFSQNPRMVLLESPSNPLMRIADLPAAAALARDHNSLLVCDNTFLSPILQNPLKLGAALVYHSTTKYINGHSDIVGGCVVTNRPELVADLDFWLNSLGLIAAPFDCYQTLRGLRTLELRVNRAQENAMHLAPKLAAHPAVAQVHYPGLPSHPHHTRAKAQQSGFGGMLSLELAGGLPAAKALCGGLKLFHLAQSLGGTESLINHPATMTHVSMGEAGRAKAGITDGLLRLSIGIEAPEDLWADLKNMLDKL